MRLRHLYLSLCVLGVVLPYSQFLPWVTEHGVDPGPFIRELAQNRLAAFFALDVVVSALALWIFVFSEGAARGIRHLWLPVAATLLVGVSFGLPLFLYMRQRRLDLTRPVYDQGK